MHTGTPSVAPMGTAQANTQTGERRQTGPVTPASGGNSYEGPQFIRYSTRNTEDRLIDMFFGDWHESMPRFEHGSLVLRDILTHGDNYDPPEKAAVLQYANWVSYGTLAPYASTTPSRLEGEQRILYFVGGNGEITAGGETAGIRKDIVVLMPAGLEFVMRNAGDEPLNLYVLSDPILTEFRPNKAMLIKDERTVPVRIARVYSPYTLPNASGHWAHVVRDLITKKDGLASVGDVITVVINPLTMGEPHPHGIGHEEVWLALEGTSLAFVGSQLRMQPPGMAYMLRPDGVTTHSNINFGDTPVKFFWFAEGPHRGEEVPSAGRLLAPK
ncbi:MAG: cupin domain-containing protein [Terriglobia bacterium]